MRTQGLLVMVALVTLGCEAFIDVREYDPSAGGAGGLGGAGATGGTTPVGGAGGTGGSGGSAGCSEGVIDFGDYEDVDAVFDDCWKMEFAAETSLEHDGVAIVMIPAADDDYWYGAETGPVLYRELEGDFGLVAEFEVEDSAGQIPTESHHGAGVVAYDMGPSPTWWVLADLARHGVENNDLGAGVWTEEGFQPTSFQGVPAGHSRFQVGLCRFDDTIAAYRRLEGQASGSLYWTRTASAAQKLGVGFTVHRYPNDPPADPEPVTGTLLRVRLIQDPFVDVADCLERLDLLE